MQAIADYVSAVPGCSKSVALRAVGAVFGGLFGAWLGSRAARRARRLQALKESLGKGRRPVAAVAESPVIARHGSRALCYLARLPWV